MPLFSVVKGNHVTLKLIQFTERLVNQFYNMKIKGEVQIPKDLINNQREFLATEDSQRNQIKTFFERLSTAKVLVDGFVVPSIVCTPKYDKIEEYTLTFVTATNKLYQIDFDLFFLHAGTRVKVQGPINLAI